MFPNEFLKSTSQRFDGYIAEVRQRASDCKFGGIADSPVKDMLICGISDLSLDSERFLRELDLTLDKAILAGQGAEETCKQANALVSCDTDIDKVEAISQIW